MVTVPVTDLPVTSVTTYEAEAPAGPVNFRVPVPRTSLVATVDVGAMKVAADEATAALLVTGTGAASSFSVPEVRRTSR